MRKKRVAHLRHHFVDPNYPLDSIISKDDNLTYKIINKPILDDFLNFTKYTDKEFWDRVDKFWNKDFFSKEACHWTPKPVITKSLL